MRQGRAALDGLPVDERTVTAPQVLDEGPVFLDVEAGMLAGYGLVVDGHVAPLTPTDGIFSRRQLDDFFLNLKANHRNSLWLSFKTHAVGKAPLRQYGNTTLRL
jgi:hypothetical protein